jgi:hypothetical protein
MEITLKGYSIKKEYNSTVRIGCKVTKLHGMGNIKITKLNVQPRLRKLWNLWTVRWLSRKLLQLVWQ